MESTYTIEVGEARLEAVISGAGDTVILLPAGSHHIGYLAPFTQHLVKAGFRAVAVILCDVVTTARIITRRVCKMPTLPFW